MIYEFALDPALVAQWADPREFRRYSASFGIGTSRVMSRVPNRQWVKLVWDAFERSILDLDEPKKAQRRKNLDSLLTSRLRDGAARRACPDVGSWVDMALREHDRRPFQALVVGSSTATPSPASAPVLQDPDFDDQDARWSPEHRLIRRRPDTLVESVAQLISSARWIRIVEPHFDPTKKRWCTTILRLLARAQRDRAAADPLGVEIHSCVSRDESARPAASNAQAEQVVLADKRIKGLAQFATGLPRALAVDVYFWAERSNGPEMHDRFLLTDLGGLQLGKGFDAKDDEEHREDETISILSRGVFGDLSGRYAPSSPTFDRRGYQRVVGASVR